MTEDPYRGDGERLRRRVTELEEELAEARSELRALRGEDRPSSLAESVFGAPLALREELVLDGELPPGAHEDLADRLRARLGGTGQPSSIGNTFAWSTIHPQASRQVDVSVRSRAGQTTIRVAERLGNLAGGLFGGIGGGVGIGGFAAIIPLLIAGLTSPALVVLGAVTWVLLVLLGTRALYAAIAGGRQRQMRKLLAELRGVCEQHLVAAQRGPRIAEDDGASDAEREALAEEEAAVGTRRVASR